MPKTEATGLAPLLIGRPRTLERRCLGVFAFDFAFDFDLAISGWWSFRAEALGFFNAHHPLGFARALRLNFVALPYSAARIGDLHGLA